jgi:hypothetical protein
MRKCIAHRNTVKVGSGAEGGVHVASCKLILDQWTEAG